MTIDNETYFAMVEAQLAEGRRVKLTLRGTSMLTALHDGEPAIIEPLDGQPQVGDVVLFRIGGRHILHRVVAIEGDRYTMQGDNSLSTEHCTRADLVARLVEVPRLGAVEGAKWQRASRCSMRRGRLRRWAASWIDRDGRRRLRPWYFVLLAFLMWAPLNGLGIPLDNYIFGLRTDHLLHASVFLPCALMLLDLVPRRSLAWLAAVAVGMLTEGVQYLLPYRGFDINDLVANFLGVSLGFVITLIARKYLS